MSFSSYDSWLTHNPADDGDTKDLELAFKCDNEWPQDHADPDLHDWIQCDFDDVVEVEAWVDYNGSASGEWKCPKCGKVSEFDGVDVSVDPYDD